MRRLAAGVLVATAGAIGFVGAAAACYPGGTMLDPQAPGHDLWRNFLCDLVQPVALNGAPNRVGATLAPIGMILLGLGIVGFFWLLPVLFPARPRLGTWVRGLGLAALGGLIAVPLTTTEAAGGWHAVAIFSASTPATAAVAVGTWGLFAAGWRRLAALGLAVFVVGTVDGALYIARLAGGGPVPLALPLLQRVDMALLLAWLLAVAWIGRYGDEVPARP